MDTLPIDIFACIRSYAGSADVRSLCQTCTACSRYGWLRSISVNGSKSARYPDFIELCIRHRHSLEKVCVWGLRDPLIWLPDWYPNLEFIDCKGKSVLTCINEAKQRGAKLEKRIKITEVKQGEIVTEKFIDVPRLSAVLI